jgi:hypothetical protein
MNVTNLKNLLQTWLGKLREHESELSLTYHLALLALTIVLGLFGIDGLDLTDDG